MMRVLVSLITVLFTSQLFAGADAPKIQFPSFEGVMLMSIPELAAHVDVQRHPGPFPLGDPAEQTDFLWREFAHGNEHHESFREHKWIQVSDLRYWDAMSDSIVARCRHLAQRTGGLEQYLDDPIGGCIPISAYLVESDEGGPVWVIVFAGGQALGTANEFWLDDIAIHAVDESGDLVVSVHGR